MNITDIKRGRKPKTLNWPTSDFTVEDVANQNKNISRVAIQLRINKLVSVSELEKVGKKGDMGRKRIVYAFPAKTTVNPVA